MPTFVPVIETELPGLTRAEAPLATEEVISGERDVFVVPNAGDTAEEALALIAPALIALKYDFNRAPTSLTGTKLNWPHWHTDRVARREGPVTDTVNVHFTSNGEALGRFLVPRLEHPKNGFMTVRDGWRLEREGKIDPALFGPECLKTMIQGGTMVVFRGGGHQPVAHSFTNTVVPRNSVVWLAHYLGDAGSNL